VNGRGEQSISHSGAVLTKAGVRSSMVFPLPSVGSNSCYGQWSYGEVVAAISVGRRLRAVEVNCHGT